MNFSINLVVYPSGYKVISVQNVTNFGSKTNILRYAINELHKVSKHQPSSKNKPYEIHFYVLNIFLLVIYFSGVIELFHSYLSSGVMINDI